jgi:DNA-binding CsgD family transcriptional regulator
MSSVLVLRGEPGAGKTALLGYAVKSAGDFDVVRLAGIESEAELGFAALHQLLLPCLGGLDALPEPQRRALSTVFGLSGGGLPDRFLVGLASLTLLSAAAAARPLLCVVDDAQWLDQESADVLSFVARRLHADAICMLFAVRDPAERRVGLDGLPELLVGGLPAAQAQELLASAAAGITEEVSQQIIAQTGGNPLGLIELGSELTAGQLAGQVALPEPLPLGPSLEARFLRQVRQLPAATQTLLLTVAADPAGDQAQLWRAGERLGFGVHAAGPAETHGLLHFGPLIRFRHPLIRSAVYHGASVVERTRVHEALAAVTDPARDADLRAWHRAAAATKPDEAVAAELEQAADWAKNRGGWAATGTFLTRAAEFTPDATVRACRVLAAAEADATAGAPLRAQALLDSVAQFDDPRQRSEALRVQAVICYTRDQLAQTASLLVSAAHEIRPLDIGQARLLLLDAIGTLKVIGRLASGGVTDVEIARAARSMPLPPQSAPTAGDLLLDAETALLLDGLDAAAPLLRRAIAALLDAPAGSRDWLTQMWIGCWAAGALGDDDVLHALASRMESQTREQGAVPALSAALYFTGVSELFAGNLGQALACYTERAAIESALGSSCDTGLVLVLAWRGQASETRAQAAAAARVATGQGKGWKLAWLEYARAVLELGRGHYERALEAAPRAYADNVLVEAFALPDVIEAAVRCGQQARAGQAMERLAYRAAASRTPLTLGLLARSRALLEDGPEAESFYQEAFAELHRARGSGHLARTHLLYGEWLRRAKRRRDAREQLRTAHGMFEDMGAAAFAERARLELAATGETVGKRDPGHGFQLTPQETEVTALAATGATNAEIAAKLFVSPKTVDYHLGKAYRKLGIGSRRELGRIAVDRA